MRAHLPSKDFLLRAGGTALVLGAACLLLFARLSLAAADLPYGQGLLWKVERQGVAPSYVFGTIHITDERVLDLPDPVRAAFDGARSATFEVIMNDELRLQLAQAMVLSDGRTLDGILGPERFEQAAEAGARYGLAPQQLRHFKPWALAMFYSVPQAELARSAAGRVPLDQWLQSEARRQGKPIHQLESGAEQIALFNDMAEADQIAMLEATIEDNGRIERLFEELTQRYLAGDIGGIRTEMLERSSNMNERILKLFLLRFNEERNRTMAARLAERLEEGGTFVAVGALHLPGERGLLRLIEDQGYSLERAY